MLRAYSPDGGHQHSDEDRRFAVTPQNGFHLFKRNGAWVATGRGKTAYADGPSGKRDAINQLYGLTRFVSPLKAEGFSQFDPEPPAKKAAGSEARAA